MMVDKKRMYLLVMLMIGLQVNSYAVNVLNEAKKDGAVKSANALAIGRVTSTADSLPPGKNEGQVVFIDFEENPQFPGGNKALLDYLKKNIKYPKQAKKHRLEGKVIVRFIVDEKGRLSDVTVIRKLDPECDQEAIRVVKKMPRWKPGVYNGKIMPVHFNLPIRFQLPKSGAKSK